MRTFGRWSDLGVATAIVVLLPPLAGFPLPFVRELGLRFDPYQYWFPQTLHQISQAVLTLILMRAFSRMPLRDWGVNLREWRLSLRVTLIFCAAWMIPAYLLVQIAPQPTTPITNAELTAVLLAHFVITGATQELLFRGFVMTYLMTHWRGGWSWRNWKLSHAGVLATLLFMLAHVKFSAPYFEPIQLIASGVLGLYYAVLFERTRSLLGPSLSHNFSNGAYVLILVAKYAWS